MLSAVFETPLPFPVAPLIFDSGQRLGHGNEQAAAPDSIQTGEQITIYPNPAASQVFIDLPPGSDVTMDVYNTLGRRMPMISASDKATRRRLDVSSWPGGLYLFLIREKAGRNFLRKIIIHR